MERQAAPGSSLFLAKSRGHSPRTGDCPCGFADKSKATMQDILPRFPFRDSFRVAIRPEPPGATSAHRPPCVKVEAQCDYRAEADLSFGIPVDFRTVKARSEGLRRFTNMWPFRGTKARLESDSSRYLFEPQQRVVVV